MTAELLARAERALFGRSAHDLTARFRAIVGPTGTQDAQALAALATLREGRVPTPLEIAALELVIKVFRPALLTSDGGVPPLGAEEAGAFPAYEDFRSLCAARARAVCRVDRGPLAPDVVPRSVGTAFLVTPRHIATNRHVLEVLALGGRDLERGMATVHFGQEHGRPDSPELGPIDVLRVFAVHEELDLAIFELAAYPKASPLTLSCAAPTPGQPVVAVGYPLRDARNPLFVDALFESKFGVRRAAPGEVLSSRGLLFGHDCTTLGGSSGSPVLDMATGEVVGVHAQGNFLSRNGGVVARGLQELLEGLPA